MDKNIILRLLSDVKSGKVSVNQALLKLKDYPFSDIGFAKVDHHRHLRQGVPEVIYCPGKSIENILGIMENMLNAGSVVLATRADKEVFERVKKRFNKARYNELGRIISIGFNKQKKTIGKVVIVSAGTADIPVAEESRTTCLMCGSKVGFLYDVGVAGIHRLFKYKDVFKGARAVIVVAGMEGALASVVGGIVDVPVIGVPTSVGYGVNFNGVAPLLTMLNSCSPNVCAVNIDNGFGAGVIAHLINVKKSGG